MTLQGFSAARRLAVATLIAAGVVLFAGSAARAQTPNYAIRQESITGTVRSFDGAYTMYVRDNRGYLDRVQLHQGTIITPTGLTLEAGMHVTVYGHPAGPVFIADDIETPYRYIPVYYPRYAGYPYWYTPYWRFGFPFGDRCCR